MFNFKLSKTMRDVQWSFISLATASLSHLLLRIVLGRELGPSGLGVYTLVFTIYIFGTQFAAFGIGAALTKYVAEFNDDLAKTKEYISSGMIGSVITGSAMGIILYLLSDTISTNIFNIPEMAYLLKITALCFPFIAINKAVLGALNGFRSMKAFAFIDIALNATVLLVSVFLVLFLDMNIFGAVLGFVIPTIFLGLIAIFFARSNLIYPNKTFLQNDILRNVLRFGFYVVLGNSIGYIYTNIDSLMIGYYLNETDVGFYAVAAIFIQGITLIPSAIQRITSPIITKNHAKKEYGSIVKLLKSVTLKVFLISLLFSLFLMAIGKTLILTIFGEVFLPAYLPLIILLIGYTIYSTFMSIGTFYSSVGHVKLSYKVALLSAILNIVLNIAFIPKYGIIGAAIATSTSLVVLTLVHFAIIRHFVRRVWKLKV
ncbi:flippase [Methanosarcina mazei]|uniref:Polysaccharide biosynthesis protein n=1 Tax=Methanosarcina mazei TaxID=2209 RepID=A0A0F8JEL5_METMZ|nr:flippase [Methanosarcina mazei]KKG67230.1 polysaccharide biosynthesis protein [Methanosarcina mazei]